MDMGMVGRPSNHAIVGAIWVFLFHYLTPSFIGLAPSGFASHQPTPVAPLLIIVHDFVYPTLPLQFLNCPPISLRDPNFKMLNDSVTPSFFSVAILFLVGLYVFGFLFYFYLKWRCMHGTTSWAPLYLIRPARLPIHLLKFLRHFVNL